jgi:hypothetical protein
VTPLRREARRARRTAAYLISRTAALQIVSREAEVVEARHFFAAAIPMRAGEAIVVVALLALVGYCCVRAEPFSGPDIDPYTILNRRLDMVRGQPNAARYIVPNAQMVARGERRLKRALQKATASPEQVMHAERASWAAMRSAEGGGDNTETYGDAAAETIAAYETSPDLDYGKYITDLVADPYTILNHKAWANEMSSWSRTTFSPETPEDLYEMEEAAIDFRGLRRPQAVVVSNPQSLTQITSEQLASNKKFDFQG